MTRITVATVLLLVFVFWRIGFAHDAISEKTSKEFIEAQERSLKTLEEQDFFKNLSSAAIAAKSTIKDIKPLKEIVTSRGTTGVLFDVVLQPGHYKRTDGATGTAGKFVSEQELAAFVIDVVAKNLQKSGLKVLIIGADDFLRDNKGTKKFEGMNTYVFLALHGDGSEKPCASATSLGYDSGSDLLGMHALAFALATSLGIEYDKFMKDNFTVNLAKYYVFKHVKARGFKGVMELGELTCPDEEKLLIESASLIGQNLSTAIESSLKIIKQTENN